MSIFQIGKISYNKRNMKIVYFIDTLPPNYDGVVKTFCHLTEILESDGINFRIYSSFKPGNQFTWGKRVRKIFSVPFLLYQDYRMGLPYFKRLYPELDDFKPDLIHAVGPTPLSHFGIKYARKRKIRAVASYHTNFIAYLPYYHFPPGSKKLAVFLQKRFFGNCDLVYVPSRNAAQDLRRMGTKKIEIWERGVDIDKFSPLHRNENLRKSIKAEGQPVLLYVGRLVKEKDLDDLVIASTVLQEKGYSFKLVLVGDGPQKKSLKKKLPRAIFTGFLSQEKLAEWYASSDLFVFPSTTETYGNVIAEAFASGIPAVVVNKGGVTENLINGVNGLIARAKSPRDFAEKVEYFLKNRSAFKRMGEAARHSIENKNWSSVNHALLKSYKKLLQLPRE
jgi:glycosyltransferase involved in cell wall biosynthesis